MIRRPPRSTLFPHTALYPALTDATQQETVNPAAAAKLVFATAAQTLTAGVSSGTITVQRQDQFNNPTTTGSQTVYLFSDSTGGRLEKPRVGEECRTRWVP